MHPVFSTEAHRYTYEQAEDWKAKINISCGVSRWSIEIPVQRRLSIPPGLIMNNADLERPSLKNRGYDHGSDTDP